MSRPPRILLPHTVALLTSRVQEGLPFVCTPLMEKILWSALATAQTLHPVKIIAFVVMANHIHIVVLIEEPTGIEGFMERFKCETAHAVNKLLGRRQVTVWCEGYDSPAILTIDDLIEKLAYVYANPARANRTDSISSYLGASSWRMFTSGQLTKEVKRIRRPLLQPLFRGSRSIGNHNDLADLIEEQTNELISFTLSPNAWTKAFPHYAIPADFNRRVLKRLEEMEDEAAVARKEKGRRVPSVSEVLNEPMNRPYAPTSFGRRMWCICRDIPIRLSFIALIKSLKAQAREARQKWAQGYRDHPFPPGLFPPCQPPLANLLPAFVRRSLAPTQVQER